MDLTPQMMGLVGAATAMLGVALVIWGAQSLARTGSENTGESLLAPTLAVDTLDADLRIAYMRTLVVDARESARRTSHSAMGRELRRALVAVQAARVAHVSSEAEPELLSLVAEVCDEAAAPAPDRDRDHQVARARELRRRLLSEVEDPRMAE